jgi:hypothetical protein
MSGENTMATRRLRAPPSGPIKTIGSDEVVNESNVFGSMVSDALDNLEASIPSVSPFTALFSGNITVVDRFIPVAGFQTPTTFAEAQNNFVSPRSGTLTAFAWSSDTADGTTTIGIFKNGLLAQLVTCNGVRGVALISVSVTLGDYLGVFVDGGTVPGKINATLS